MARREAEVANDAFGREPDPVEVRERFAHPHEHHVIEASAVVLVAARPNAMTTCSTISPVVSWRVKPASPVAQNWQRMAHPAWEEMQTVEWRG